MGGLLRLSQRLAALRVDDVPPAAAVAPEAAALEGQESGNLSNGDGPSALGSPFQVNSGTAGTSPRARVSVSEGPSPRSVWVGNE